MAVAFFLNMIHISLLILQMCIDWLLFPWHCTKHSGVDPGCEGVMGVLYAANWCCPLTLIPVWKIWVRSSRKEKKKKSEKQIFHEEPFCEESLIVSYSLFLLNISLNLVYLKLAFILCQMFIFCHWLILC